MFDLLKDLKELKDSVEGFKKKRSCAVRSINRDRKKFGYFEVTFLKIKEIDPQQFFIHVYDVFLNLIQPFLVKKSITKHVEPECRLVVTLLYLTQGCIMQSIAWSFKLGKETIRSIVLETCDIIWKVLSPVYVSEPNVNELAQISEDFWQLWNMPNCIGAIDGKHISIQCPPNSSSEYYNYKHFFSIVLLASVDARYTFMYVDVGAYGSQSDGGIFQASRFGRKLLSKNLQIPPPKTLPGTNNVVQHYFVADATFPLGINLMKPFPGSQLTKEKEVYNKTLSRARRIVKNAFGVLVARWRILLTTINMYPENVEKVVLACIALYNFLKLNELSKTIYCPRTYVDWEDTNHEVHNGLWRAEVAANLVDILPSRNRHTYDGRLAIQTRNILSNFLNNEGALDWQ